MKEFIKAALGNLFHKRLPLAGPLEIPDETILRKAGFDAGTLRKRSILPQPSHIAPAGYALVTAQPAALSIREFEQTGVQVLFASAHDIERAWQDWEVARLEPEELDISSEIKKVLYQIVSDCAALGAEEVFVGHPSNCSYEGVVHGKRFSGFVHQRVFLESLAAVQKLGQFSLASVPPCRAALTRNFERPIICLTWTIPDKPKPPSRPDFIQTGSAAVKIPVRDAPAETHMCSDTSRLLLVEDDERFALVLTQILQARGYEVLRAINGEQALRFFAPGGEPDLVVSDVHMPVRDGRSLIAEIRERKLSVPVLMLTSDDNQLLEADLVMLGANAYIRKNEDPRVLLAWIQNLLHRGEKL